METFKRTPMQLFNLPQHFMIPLFQRPYVWKQEEQWEPLWKDICRVAELRIEEPHLKPQHFLGAVVLQAHDATAGQLNAWNVVDGQQRLTTLQLLMDAASAALTANDLGKLASQLESLTHNSINFVDEGESRLKLRHLNRDRAAFDEVMDAEAPVDYANLGYPESQIVRAHQFFSVAIAQWLGDPEAEAFSMRAEQLATVIQNELQLVTIELSSSENSQEIFETLNARGTPLTAADLIRNFVFQNLELQGEDTAKAYKEDWPFEKAFWAKEVSVGRFFVSRSSLFFNQWLAARLGEEISPQATFARFKSYVEHHADVSIAELLIDLKRQAAMYEQWTEAARATSGNLSPVEMAVYRMSATGSQLLHPLLIWLHEPGRDLPQATIDSIVRAAESWVIRRQLLRLTNTDLGRVVADLIRLGDSTPKDDLSDRIISHLSRLSVTSTYWPGDEEVRAHLETENAYKRYPRARLRMVLEAIENSHRAETRQPQVERTKYPIEHILPQKWQDHWPVATPEDQIERQDHIHLLGNLTLLTSKLNSKVSNSPWTAKRSALLQHNTIKLTGRLLDLPQEAEWDEARINQRTSSMIASLLAIWPVPDGHTGRVDDPQTKDHGWIEVKHLVSAGLIPPGTPLAATYRDFHGVTGVVTANGLIELDGKQFASPSGAGRHLHKKPLNGWLFWAMPDGRRLADVRSEYQELRSSED
ncbi:DUF262 domain-containing protein [Dietzia sp. ANT_WB102]|uniref:GmrSD restriction endonuclease domain-containing protein n=1 Tax=Dietzia sp. ANT_WB102 TaxID=2597345 RepID=UPI0011ED3A5F|nr:DUF262 domain-containing protein [Dietzia sp. ANT_WB102]KAA0919257.1 DUF262 domain-containing protein [Dietzia sp. ANT_WB102]